MSELRRDPLSGRWMISAAGRRARPTDTGAGAAVADTSANCPFCPGRDGPDVLLEAPLPPAESREGAPRWSARVLSNKYPALLPPGAPGPAELTGLAGHDTRPGVGFHEVVVTSSEHGERTRTMSVARLEAALGVAQQRMQTMTRDPTTVYLLLLENRGGAAGASRAHPHWQMLAMPVVPEGLRRRLANSGAHHAATGRCLVCDLIDAERRDGRRIVLEDEHFVSMVPFGSGMPFEVRLAPRRHESSFLDLDATRTRALAGHLREALSKLANALQDPPYNWFLHTSPVRPTDGTFHWHIELMPRLSQFAAYELATEGWINPVPPEEGAAELRRA